ncbi:hypothetical protein ACIGW0_23320 [Streptomyces bikiniensis]|uniref:Uncharacterized protein n=1 Tax=Streptomyces bikiniensis TaxID=1896 RepID=A0ABW8D0Z9_STRBI
MGLGVPALVLPFSSNRFVVAGDAERAGAGPVLDPNGLKPSDVPAALETVWSTAAPNLRALAAAVRARGPRWAAAELLTAMDRQVPGG